MDEFQYFIEYFKQSPPIIQFVWFMGVVFFVIIIVLVIYLKFLRSYLRKNEKITLKYQKEYESNLITFLYSGNDEESISSEQQLIIDKLKNCVKDKFKREIVVSVLLKLRNEISGEMAESIQKLYFQTGLINYALVKLKNKNWYFVAKAIRELTQFHVKEVYDEIVKQVNHPKREVRKEVQLYLVNLFRFEGLEFLNELQTPLTEWDQIQLLEELQRFDDQQIQDVTPWLKSTNDFVVIFALKLAKIYNQFEVKDALLNLLTHPSKKVRLELIPVLSHLMVFEAKEILKRKFIECSIEEQIAFFKLLEYLFDANDESFILEQVHHENFEIEFSALKILKALNSEKLGILKLESTELKFIKIIEFIENN